MPVTILPPGVVACDTPASEPNVRQNAPTLEEHFRMVHVCKQHWIRPRNLYNFLILNISGSEKVAMFESIKAKTSAM